MAYINKKTDKQTEEAPKELSADDKNIVSEVVADFNRAKAAKKGKETLFTEIYRRYRSYLDISRETTRSTLFIPESFTLVETVAPRLTARKPTFKVLPRESSDIKAADKVGSLLDHRYDVMGLQEKIKDYVKQGLIYGTSFIKVGWDTKNKRPTAEMVDIADMYGDPESTSWQGGFVIHRFYKSLYDLKQSAVGYQNLDILELRSKSTVTDNQMKQDRQSIQDTPVESQVNGIECYEWWGRVDGKITVRTVADGAVLIRNKTPQLPLDEYPFIELFDQKVPFEKWGIGEIEPILDLQDEENTIRNQRIDEKNLSIHNMWVVSKMAGVDYKTIVSKPGGIILANDITGIKPLEKQNITQDSVLEINLIKNDIRNATGVNDYIRGADTGQSTATETVTKTQEANMRFADKVNNLEIALKKIGKWIVALDSAYLTQTVRVRILNKFGDIDQQEINPEDIREEYDIDIETGSSLPANPDLRRQQLKELVQVISPFLLSPNGIPDGLRELLRSVIQAYDFKNADEILQGAEHPEVAKTMAQLTEGDMGDVNPQMVQQEIKRRLLAEGGLQPVAAAVPGQPAARGTDTPLPPPVQQ